MTDLYETIRRDLLGNGGLLDPSKGSLSDEGAPPKLLLAGVALLNKMIFASIAVSFMSKRYATEFLRRESLRRKQPFTCLKNKTGGSVSVSAGKQDFEEIVRNRFGKAGMFVAQNNNTRAFGVCAGRLLR
jgi:hypothetical protein